MPYRKVLVEDSLWSFGEWSSPTLLKLFATLPLRCHMMAEMMAEPTADEDEKTGQRLFVWTLVKLTPTEGRKHWKCVVHGEPEIDTMR